MPDPLQTLPILCPLVFLAGFIDSIAGGGGLVSLPAYLLCGFPAHVAFGSNKMSSSVGTLVATWRYARSRSMDIRAGLAGGAAALAGSFAGARLALAVSDRFLRMLLLVLLPVVAATTLLRRKGDADNANRRFPSGKRLYAVTAGICLLIGAYDGFFGPGTGTFLILAFTGVLGFDYAKAGGTAKIVNLASNIAAVTLFAANAKIVLWAAVPAALCSVAGNWIGSGMAIRRGAGFIRTVLVGVLILLFIRLLVDFLAG
ncbi:MAG: TSUP family transporter [Clostridia bacterium]|nr:TSUP family transporter [Clostridia bacterium]